MKLRLNDWLPVTLRRGRPVAESTPPPAPAATAGAPHDGPPYDHDRAAQLGEALQSCFPEHDGETLDDRLTALMLRLTVEPPEFPDPHGR